MQIGLLQLMALLMTAGYRNGGLIKNQPSGVNRPTVGETKGGGLISPFLLSKNGI
jgi:hypothetical protein